MKFRLTSFLTAVLIATVSSAQIPNYVPTTGLVGWWPFDGNANDESGNGNNGSVNGALLTNDRFGIANKAYSFDGITNSIIVPNSISLDISGNQITISYWVNFQNNITNGNYQGVSKGGYDYGNGYELLFQASSNNSGVVSFNSGYGGYNCFGGIDIYQNQWLLLTATFNNGIEKIYLNDVLQTSISSGAGITNFGSNNNSLYFGTRDPSNGYVGYLSGKLDDIGIWNRALTQQEITDLYNGCQLSVNTQPTNQTINANNNAQFVVSSSDTNATYQWQTDLGLGFQNISNAGQYSGANTDTLVVSNVSLSNNNQQFRCIVNPGSCMDTSDIAVLTVNNNVGIIETSPDNLLSIFPNPTKDNFSISGLDKLGNVTSLALKDVNGKTIKVLDPKATEFNISELKPGVYFLTITAVNKQQVIKLIKE